MDIAHIAYVLFWLVLLGAAVLFGERIITIVKAKVG